MIEPSNHEPTVPSWQSWGGRILVVLLSFWNAFVVLSAQGTPWFMAGAGVADAMWPWVWAVLAQTVLVALPAALLAWKWPLLRYRAAFQTWLLACAYPLLLALTRLILPTHSQLLLLAQTGLTAVFILILWRKQPFGKPAWLAISLALLVSLPWFLQGALGSLLDTVLTLILGLMFGVVVGLVNGRSWLPTLPQHSQGSGWDITLGGFVMGTAVLILASALSFNGTQILLIIALPALAWVMAALAIKGNSLSSGLLIGLTAAIILAFTDTDAMNLVAFDGILFASLQAMLSTAVFAWVVGFVLFFLRERLGRGNGRLAPAFTLITLALSLFVYFSSGQPGLYGDRLFVILNTQADVSSASTIADYDQRRQFVYDTLTSHAQTTQADLRQSLDNLGLTYTPYYLVNALEVRGGLLVRLWLATRPDVDRVMPSPVLRPISEDAELPSLPEPAPSSPQWNLTNIGADRVWQELGVRGAGIIVGQSDSGVQWDHPELMDGYLGSAGDHSGYWLDPWRGTVAPVDNGGHGTHTLGSVLGNNTGVAPDAQWFACANLVRNLGNPALYLDCMQFMLAPYPQGGDPLADGRPTQSAHVLNNSWGCPETYEGCDPESLLTAVRALRAAGIFVVVSAGNSGPNCSSVEDAPAIYDEVFSVGAVDFDNNIASFSSTGPVAVDGSGRVKPDIAAPGVDVLSAMPGSSYGVNSGTSMAGPHVAGVVALIWSANPALIGDIEQTETILQASATRFQPTTEPASEAGEADFLTQLEELGTGTADPTTGTCLAETDTSVVPNNIAGYGIVNAYEAVKMALGEK
ncbi:MAG: S8 family serine peptidase [Ardenticatenaceae bacterium]|nr:S8 family serine peptidase [Ardenticatenaceae bacterium]